MRNFLGGISGFQGHPFQTRYRHSAFTKARGGEGATFVCFLDCVWQLYRQYAWSFEFTESFLVLLFDNVYSSEYGTYCVLRQTVELLTSL